MTTSFSISDTAFASLDMQGADTQPLSPIYFLQRPEMIEKVQKIMFLLTETMKNT